MPWCPKCRRFQEDDDLCSYCWVETVEELEPERESVREEYLFTVRNEMEANIVIKLLESNGIPVLTKHSGPGQYLQVIMGSSNFGVDLYVSETQLEMAQGLLASKFENLSVLTSLDLDEMVDDEKVQHESQNKVFLRSEYIILGIIALVLIYLLSKY